MPERVQMYGRQLTAQQKDERRQDNSDEKRLACCHPSDLLRLLTHERIGEGQYSVVSPALRASLFRTFHVLHVRHMLRMRIPSTCISPYKHEMTTLKLLHTKVLLCPPSPLPPSSSSWSGGQQHSDINKSQLEENTI